MLEVTLFLAALLLLLIGLSVQRRYRRVGAVAARVLVSYLTLLLLLGMGEAFFRYVYAESGWGFTLAYKNWQARYWEENSLGFRDREWTPADWEGKTTVMVIGDSFSAGWGLENVEDRYSDMLADKLGDDYAVINLSRPGGTPPRELAWVQEHPLQDPDIIIYQYYLNDIDDAALSIGDYWEFQIPDRPRFVDESYLANFIFWRIAPLYTSMAVSDDNSYWAWNNAAYFNSVIFDIHREELNAVMDYAESRDARLIVVIFPNMRDPVSSIGHIDAIEGVFRARGYTEILPLDDEAAGWEVAEAVVSSRDAHPSAAFHQRVAEMLYDDFFAEE